MGNSPDFYEVLNLPKDSSFQEIRKAYKILAKKWHPDKHPISSKAEAEARFKAGSKAYEKQKNPDGYNPIIGWVETHKGKDQSSISYREQVLEKAAEVEVGPDSPLTIISPILDSISGGHHVGYERGIGNGRYRRYMTTPVIHDCAVAQTQKEASNQMESKMQQLEQSLNEERRAREEMERRHREEREEMERHHREEQEKSKAQITEMHRYMAAFFHHMMLRVLNDRYLSS